MISNPTNEHREQARDLIHAARNSVKCSPQHRGDSGPYCLECPDLRDEAVIVAVARALSSRDSEKWQPVQTAPKDGTAILGYFGNTAGDEPPDMAVTKFDGYKWISTEVPFEEFDAPTHWMPLPDPPPLPSENPGDTFRA